MKDRAKHILIVNRYFYPDVTSVPQLLTELAEDLVRAGYKISVVCSRNSYNGSTRYRARDQYRDIDIRRVGNIHGRGGNLLFRLAESVTFFCLVLPKILMARGVDLFVVLSSPPLLAGLVSAAALFRVKKYMYIAEDIYPDIAVALGVVKKNGLLEKMLRRITRTVVHRATVTVVLGDFMKRKILAHFQKNPPRIQVVANWADGRRIFPVARSAGTSHTVQKPENRFVVQYSGNMGLAHDFTTILSGIYQLREANNILFQFIGDGPRRREIAEFCHQSQLETVEFLPYRDYRALNRSLNSCDIALVSIRNGLEGLIVPSKIFGILAAGKPFVLVSGSENEVAALSREFAVGRVVAEGDVDTFVGAVRFYMENPETVAKEGRTARELFERFYDRRMATRKYIDIIGSILKP